MAASREQVLLTEPSDRGSYSNTPRISSNSRQIDPLEITDQQKIEIIGKQLERAFGKDLPPPGERGDPGDNLQAPNEDGYIPPIQDPYQRAIVYLERHNILQLFQNITADIVYKRPEDPINFMIDEIDKLLNEKKKNSPTTDTLSIAKPQENDAQSKPVDIHTSPLKPADDNQAEPVTEVSPDKPESQLSVDPTDKPEIQSSGGQEDKPIIQSVYDNKNTDATDNKVQNDSVPGTSPDDKELAVNNDNKVENDTKEDNDTDNKEDADIKPTVTDSDSTAHTLHTGEDQLEPDSTAPTDDTTSSAQPDNTEGSLEPKPEDITQSPAENVPSADDAEAAPKDDAVVEPASDVVAPPSDDTSQPVGDDTVVTAPSSDDVTVPAPSSDDVTVPSNDVTGPSDDVTASPNNDGPSDTHKHHHEENTTDTEPKESGDESKPTEDEN